MTVADRIKKIREEKGITQEELALAIGLKGKSSVAKIEAAGNSISTKSIYKYAQALNVDVADLMGWREEAIEQGVSDYVILQKIHRLTSSNRAVLESTLDALLNAQES